MKRYVVKIFLCLFLLPLPLLADKKELLTPLESLEMEIVNEKIPKGYEKSYAYRLNGEYVSRYDKTIPGGKDPYDAYIITIDIDSNTLKDIERHYIEHPKLEEKKLISEKKAIQLSTAVFRDYDGITLSLVEPDKLTPYGSKATSKTGLRYAYLIRDDYMESHMVLYLDAYDGEILGLDQYNSTSDDTIPKEPESFFLNLWEAIKRFFGYA